jgi:SAM-dependent methyltransferase
MEPAAIGAAYDLLSGRWRDDAFDPRHGQRQLRQALAFAGEGGWALNVGCGCNTRFNGPLRAHGLRIEGVDVSHRMIELARAADPEVLLHHADIDAWTPPRAYRFILAWDSLWHVRLDRQAAVMRKLMGALEPGGVFAFTAGGLDAPDEHVDATMGPPVYYATLGIPGLLEVAAGACCLCRHLEFDQHPEQHLFMAVQRS